MSTEDLFNISNNVFGSLNSINEKGYVTLESLEESSHYIRSIEFQLVVRINNLETIIILIHFDIILSF
jgi:hypothetical protein